MYQAQVNSATSEAVQITPVEQFKEDEKYDLIWLESPRNSTCQLFDLKKFSELAKSLKAPLIIDRFEWRY